MKSHCALHVPLVAGKSTHAYRRQRSCSETAKGSPATISRDRARMLGSKHGSSRQNGIAEAASGHVEFAYAPA